MPGQKLEELTSTAIINLIHIGHSISATALLSYWDCMSECFPSAQGLNRLLALFGQKSDITKWAPNWPSVVQKRNITNGGPSWKHDATIRGAPILLWLIFRSKPCIFCKKIVPRCLFLAAGRLKTFYTSLLKGPHRLLNRQIQVTRVSWVGQSTSPNWPFWCWDTSAGNFAAERVPSTE